MIEAVIVTKEFSEPILIRTFTKKFESLKTVLVSQILEAIRSLAEQELGDEISEIKLEQRVIYIWKVKGFVLAIVTDGQESKAMLESLIRNVTNIIGDYEPEDLMLDTELQRRVSREIASFVLMERMSLPVLMELAEDAKSLLSIGEVKGRKLKVPKVKIKIMRPKPSLVGLIRARKGFNVNEFLELFGKGRLEEVVKKAVNYFGDEKYGDAARVFYVKAGLILHTRPGKYPAPELENLLGVAESIKDDLLREIMVGWVESFWSIDALVKTRMFYIEKRREINERMRSSKEEEAIFLIALLGLPDMRLLSRLISLAHNKYPFLESVAYSKQLLIQISATRISGVEDWLKIHNFVRKKYEELKSEIGGEFLSLAYLVSLIWALEAKDISMEDLNLLFSKLDNYWKEEGEGLFNGSNMLSSCHRMAIKTFAFYYPELFRLYLGKLDKKKVERILEEIEKTLGKVVTAIDSKRLLNMMVYRLVFAATLDIFSRFMYYSDELYVNLIDFVIEAIDPEMSKSTFVNRFHLTYYMLSLLSAVAHIVLMAPESTIRKQLIVKILEFLRDLIPHTKSIAIYNLMIGTIYKELVEAIPEEERTEYLKTLEELKANLSEAATKMLE